jgi:hypothetical protein
VFEYSKVYIGNHLSDSFPIQNGLEQGDALSPLLFDFALDYTIRKAQENQVGLKLNGTPQLLTYSKEAGLELNVEKTTYMLVSRHQNVVRNRDIKIANRSFGNVSQLTIFVDDSNKSKFDSGEN